MARLETFIEIESQFDAFMRRRWDEAWANVQGDFQDRLTAADWNGAISLVEGVQLPEWAEKESKRLRLLSISSLRFGSSLIRRKDDGRWTDKDSDLRLLEASIVQAREMERVTAPAFAAKAVRAVVARGLGQLADDESAIHKGMYPTGCGCGVVEEMTVGMSEAEAFAVGYLYDWVSGAAQVTKDELVPGDFGYQPQAGQLPTWAVGLSDIARTGGRTASTLGANVQVSRLVNYGALTRLQAERVAIYRIKAVLDRKTSKICKRMNGKTFKVEDAIVQLERAMLAPSIGDIRQIHPWIPNTQAVLAQLEKSTSEDLAGKGWRVPPFHPRCRSVVVRAVRTTVSVTTN